MASLSALRVDLARRSKWNIGYMVAGLVYWSFATVVGTILPMESAKVLSCRDDVSAGWRFSSEAHLPTRASSLVVTGRFHL